MMRVQREQLINDLEMVKAGVSPREFIEQSSCYVFQDGEVITFNDEVACRKKCCLKGVTGAVQASSLVSILGKIPDDELTVSVNEKGELEFQGKHRRFGVTKDAEIFLPIDRVEVPKHWKPLKPDFTEAIELVRHCVSTDENRFALTCIHITPDFVEGCDNLQLMRVKVETGIKESVLVRGTSLEHIVSLGIDQICVTPSWLHFKNQTGLVYSCRLYKDEYPPGMEDILKVEGHKIVIPKGMADSTDRAEVFAADKGSGDPLVTVTLREGLIRVKGEGITGWYKEVKKTTYKGPPMEFCISPALLRHISEKYSDARISSNRLKVEDGRWTYVTVLGRPGEKQQEQEEAPKKKQQQEEEE